MKYTKKVNKIGTSLKMDDKTGITFWVISVALLAVTGFLSFESIGLEDYNQTSVLISAMVTGIASIHYFYMRQYWVEHNGRNPIIYRYIDWILTVPLQLLEFYMIFKIANVDVDGQWPYWITAASVAMIIFGYLGEANIINRYLGWFIGMIAWVFILYELLGGKGNDYKKVLDDQGKDTYDSLKWIVVIGWSLYPIGFFIKNERLMNGVYNIADFINKILFVIVVWNYAKQKQLSI